MICSVTITNEKLSLTEASRYTRLPAGCHREVKGESQYYRNQGSKYLVVLCPKTMKTTIIFGRTTQIECSGCPVAYHKILTSDLDPQKPSSHFYLLVKCAFHVTLNAIIRCMVHKLRTTRIMLENQTWLHDCPVDY
jgi:ribosomal protein S27E